MHLRAWGRAGLTMKLPAARFERRIAVKVMRFTIFLFAAVSLWSQTTVSGVARFSGNAVIYIGTSTFPSVDCTATSVDCTKITIIGDPASSTAFTGYADPTIRKDPQTSTLWLAYSWPNVVASTSVVETHVANSTDGGTTWNFVGNLYPSQVVSNAHTGATNDHSSREVANIYPFVVAGVTNWAVITNSYLVKQGGKNGSSNQPYTVIYQLVMGKDPGGTLGPMSVAGATPYRIGTASRNNDPTNFPIDADLTAISGHGECTEFGEPSIISVSTTAYFRWGCGNLTSILQFYSTIPTSAPYNSWSFTYDSNTATLPQAQGLCAFINGCPFQLRFAQSDLTKNGTKYLMNATLCYIDGDGNKVALGFVVMELATLTPLVLATESGHVKVVAKVTSSDSASYGPGSSTYDPNFKVIIAHKVGSGGGGGSTSYLMNTGLAP